MLDCHQWGTPVREYTDADVGEMLARYDALRAKFYPKVAEPGEPAQRPPPARAPRAAKVAPSESWKPWTDEETILLRRLCDEGYSSGHAARKLCRSRNACAGRANRLGLHFQRREAKPLAAPPVLSADRGASTSVSEIIRAVAGQVGVSVLELTSDSRTRPLVRARQYAMWLCARDTPHSYPVIGRMFGDRDHTTVLHAVRRENDRLKANVRLAGGVRS